MPVRPVPVHKPLHDASEAVVTVEAGIRTLAVPRYVTVPDMDGDALHSGDRVRVLPTVREIRRVSEPYILRALDACAAYEAGTGRPAPRLAEWRELRALLR